MNKVFVVGGTSAMIHALEISKEIAELVYVDSLKDVPSGADVVLINNLHSKEELTVNIEALLEFAEPKSYIAPPRETSEPFYRGLKKYKKRYK